MPGPYHQCCPQELWQLMFGDTAKLRNCLVKYFGYITNNCINNLVFIFNQKMLTKTSGMKKILTGLFTGVMFLTFVNHADGQANKTKASSFSTNGKKVMVYTTADSTNLRLSATATVEFKDMPQPLE